MEPLPQAAPQVQGVAAEPDMKAADNLAAVAAGSLIAAVADNLAAAVAGSLIAAHPLGDDQEVSSRRQQSL
jgi:hypothetical protein